MRRRYEVWFLRLALADGSGACWFRSLLTNPGWAGCVRDRAGAPVQVWATWFPQAGMPESLIQGFPLTEFRLSPRGETPFHFEVGPNWIGENACRGRLNVRGHRLSWDLKYRSNFRMTLSRKGWIGFRSKSTRLNSSHQIISYAVFCVKKNKQPARTRSI